MANIRRRTQSLHASNLTTRFLPHRVQNHHCLTRATHALHTFNEMFVNFPILINVNSCLYVLMINRKHYYCLHHCHGLWRTESRDLRLLK